MNQPTEYQVAKQKVLELLDEDTFDSFPDEFKWEVLRAIVEALVLRMPGWVYDPSAPTKSTVDELDSVAEIQKSGH